MKDNIRVPAEGASAVLTLIFEAAGAKSVEVDAIPPARQIDRRANGLSLSPDV